MITAFIGMKLFYPEIISKDTDNGYGYQKEQKLSFYAHSGPWASPALERLDEINDVEIYKAVVTSIEEWKAFKLEKRLKKREKREEPHVCYPDIGCFEANGPFAYLEMLPGSPDEIDTKFIFHPSHKYRKKGFSQVEVSFKNLSDAFKWDQQGYNIEIPTKVLIHGFGSDCSHVWVYELRSALMAVVNMNIICVDWSKGAELPNYVKAVVNTRLVGKQVALLLKGLMENIKVAPSDIHLIGFSLGAHVAGFAGSDFKNVTRITGLDPAGPLFEAQDPRARLDQSDADFVDVIHSNGENLILGGLGSWQPLGHVDFYPNGGRMQKGCSNIFLGAVSDIIWSSTIEGRSLCNHRRAYKFFIDSVSPRCHFPAFPCNSYDDFLEGRCFPCNDARNCGNMGYYADRWNGRGQLYLITRDEEPFCAHQYKINIQSSTTDIPVVSYGKIQVMLVGDSTLNETFVMTKKDDEEMVLGHAISRIFVPHPILSEPTKIEILYTAYSGWISSGLTHWAIDKITLSDSFGKLSSVCQKALVLESGKPVTLPLYPGECNLPLDPDTKNETNIDDQNKSSSNERTVKDTSTQLSFTDAMSILKIPWSKIASDTENTVIDEKETSRALNTKTNSEPIYYHSESLTTQSSREIVEPVLKPQSRKNARSHNYDANKPEISEPILVSTTTKFTSKVNDLPKPNGKELRYDFYDSSKDEWGSIGNVNNGKDTWKQETQNQKANDGFSAILMTVQFLPVKLARMFEQAEKYTRETILPFVSAHTPKIIRDFIAPEQPVKYLPLHFDESTEILEQFQHDRSKKHLNSISTEQIPSINTTFSSVSFAMTTPYTHIQKIRRKDLAVPERYADSAPQAIIPMTQRLDVAEKSKSFSEQDVHPSLQTPKTNSSKQIFVDLPIFDNNTKTKYIPIS
ncbi:hypothetical protein FQR65_LT13032 [Abscondita terminalis]|nr:hypothetical protein FQR65_LT13032 [Abscondita terminalis]